MQSAGHRGVASLQVFRQRDQRFVTLLNEMRRGCLSPFHASLLRAAVGQPSVCTDPSAEEPAADADALAPAAPTAGGSSGGGAATRPTKLFPRNEPADAENARRLSELPSALHRYRALQKPVDTKALEHCLAPMDLQLKIGAQVILLKNLDAARKLVNGSRGVVTGFAVRIHLAP